MSPFNAWVMLKSLETLPHPRPRADAPRRPSIADHLAARQGRDQGHLLRPRRPSAGGARREADDRRRPDRSTFEIEGGKEAAFRFQNALQIIKISNNLGDAKSLITHPATTTHYRIGPAVRAELGISDGMLRLSVGLEKASDLKADLDVALAAAHR